MKRKAFHVTDTKAYPDASEHGTIKGHCAVFNNVDLGNEVVLPGAFTESLKKRGSNLPAIWAHQYSEVPIGKTVVLKEDEYGLYYEAELNGTDLANNVLKAVNHGDVNGASFGYWEVDVEEPKKAGEPRKLIKLDILECGPCIWGMNPLATSEPKSLPRSFQKMMMEPGVALDGKTALWAIGRAFEKLDLARYYWEQAMEMAQFEGYAGDVQAQEDTVSAFLAEAERFRQELAGGDSTDGEDQDG